MCLSVWLHVARLHPQQGPVLGGRRGGKGGPREGEGAGLTSSGRRRWWLQVGLGSAQVPGRMGAQGHGWAAPRPAGGSEDRGPQRAPAGPEARQIRGHVALGSERLGEVGEGVGEGRRPPSRVVPGGSQGGRAPRPPRPSLHPPYTPPQARPAGCSRSRKPCGPPGRAGRVFAGGRGGGGGPGAGGGGRGAGRRGPATGPPGVRSRVVQLKCSARSVESWRAAAAGWPDRQVRAKGRRSAGLLGRPAAAASVYGHTTLNAPDLV